MAEKKSKLAQIKTKPTETDAIAFIKNIDDDQKRKDCEVLFDMMKKASGEEAILWSNNTVGFGLKVYKSPASGREVEWYRVGFSPRKTNLTIYIVNGMQENAGNLKKLGKHKTGGGCIYVNKLVDIDLKVLSEIITSALKINA